MTSICVCVWPKCEDWSEVGSPLCYEHALDVYFDMLPARPARRARHKEPSKAHREHGTIYYLRVGERIKVGWTSNLEQRLRAYPPDTTLLTQEPGTRADEAAMHQRCTPFRAAGREWYEDCEGMARVIAEAKQRGILAYEQERIEWIRANPRPRPPAGKPPVWDGTVKAKRRR